jgi:hypothetical protein
MQIFIARKSFSLFFCIQKIRFAPRFVPPVELAICSSLIKAFIEEIYNRFIVYLFPLIWCSMCGREILELFSLLRRPFARVRKRWKLPCRSRGAICVGCVCDFHLQKQKKSETRR